MILLCIIYQIWRFDYHFLSVYLQVHISSNFRPYCLIWIGWMLPSSFSSLVLQPVQGSGRHNNCFPICSYPAQVPPPQEWTPILLRSSCTSSTHISQSIPLLLSSPNTPSIIYFSNLCSSVRATCPDHRTHEVLMTFTISEWAYISLISLSFLILHSACSRFLHKLFLQFYAPTSIARFYHYFESLIHRSQFV